MHSGALKDKLACFGRMAKRNLQARTGVSAEQYNLVMKVLDCRADFDVTDCVKLHYLTAQFTGHSMPSIIMQGYSAM